MIPSEKSFSEGRRTIFTKSLPIVFFLELMWSTHAMPHFSDDTAKSTMGKPLHPIIHPIITQTLRTSSHCRLEWNSKEDVKICISEKDTDQILNLRFIPNLFGLKVKPRAKHSNNAIISDEFEASQNIEQRATYLPKSISYSQIQADRTFESFDKFTGNLFDKIQIRILKLRLRLSDTIRNHDPLGIFRKLLLSEHFPSSYEHDLFYSLGFVHITSLAAIHVLFLKSFFDLTAQTLSFFIGSHSNPIALLVSKTCFYLALLSLWVIQGFRPGFIRVILFLLLKSAWSKRRAIHSTLSAPTPRSLRSIQPLILALSIDCVFAVISSLLGIDKPFASGRLHYLLAISGSLFSLYAFVPGLKKIIKSEWLSTHIALSVGSFILCAPVDLLFDHKLALLNPIISFITVPLVTFGGIISIFIYFVTQKTIFLTSLDMTSNAVDYLLLWARKLPNLVMLSFDAQILFVVTAVILLCFALFQVAFKNIRLKLVFTFFLLLFSISVRNQMGPNRIVEYGTRVTQLNIGQGDSALVEMSVNGVSGKSRIGKSSFALLDTGEAYMHGSTEWIQLLSRRGIYKLNTIALSHADSDHASAITQLQGLIRLDCISYPEAHHEKMKNYLRQIPDLVIDEFGEEGSLCLPFRSTAVSEWSISNLSKKATRRSRSKLKSKLTLGNSVMAGFKINSDNGLYYGLGDASSKLEEKLFDKLNEGIPIQSQTNVENNKSTKVEKKIILKLSHHGSRFSSSSNFLKRVKPNEIWISAGLTNRYHHPHPVTVSRVQEFSIPIRATYLEGNIQ